MKRKLYWAASFKRAVKRAIRRQPDIEGEILEMLGRLEQNAFDPLLKTHKLSGKLSGLWAGWVEYDTSGGKTRQRDT